MRTSTRAASTCRPSPLNQEPVGPGQSCPRCQGFMVDDWLLDMAQGGCLWGTGRRCVNCGHIAPTETVGRLRPDRLPAREHRGWHAAA